MCIFVYSSALECLLCVRGNNNVYVYIE